MKSILYDVFIVTNYQKATCNVKGVVCSDESTEHYLQLCNSSYKCSVMVQSQHELSFS